MLAKLKSLEKQYVLEVFKKERVCVVATTGLMLSLILVLRF